MITNVLIKIYYIKNINGKDTLSAFVSSNSPIDINELEKYLLNSRTERSQNVRKARSQKERVDGLESM